MTNPIGLIRGATKTTDTIGVMDVVCVEKLKRPVGSGVWGAYVLAADEFGTWLHTPAGSLYRGENGQEAGVCEVAQDSNGVGRSIVQLIPPDAWWIATWYPAIADHDVTVDICTPAVFVDRTWTYGDMELDLWRDRYGKVTTDDWDEFQAARDAGWITQPEAAESMAATETIERLLRQRVEPFGRVGIDRLTVATQLALPRRP